jgi:hypothetical protein
MLTERNEIRTANAGYEAALEIMMLEKNKVKGAMSTNIKELHTDFLKEVTELMFSMSAEGKDRIADEAADCIVYLSRMIEVIRYGK